MSKKLCSIIALLTLVVSAAMAQVTTSGMSGKVTSNNEEVIGAHIQAVHTPSGTRYVAVSNENGRYSIQGMRPGGPYEVTITYVGYETKTERNITLQLGETYNLNATLTESSRTLTDVVVTGTTSKFSNEKMGSATNISNEEMMSVPTIARSITDISRLSPYGGNGMKFAGQDGRTANFTVDGANFNNNFGLSEALPGGGNPISIDAIEEMQVVIAPYDVRQTNFIGGAINAITKSGTNQYKGTAYIYHRNENMRGNNVAGTDIPTARETDRTTLYGMTLGGPIIKNKLFFFVNAEYSKTPTTVIKWRASDEKYPPNADTQTSFATAADMQRVSDFVREKYGYETGSFTDFPADQTNTKILTRIDWNINDKHKLAVRYNFTHNLAWREPNASSMDGGTRSPFSRVSLYSMVFANSLYSAKNDVHSFSIDLNSRLTDDLFNQFLTTFSKQTDPIRDSKSAMFPFIDIQDGTGSNTQYMSLGYELFTWNNAVNNSVFNIKDDITYYLTDHKITGGISYEHQMADNQYMRSGTGYYRYLSVDDFINGATPDVVALTYGYDGETKPASRVTYDKVGVYAQDEWNVNDKLKLTYGFRLDGLFFNNKDLKTNNAILDLDYNGRHIDTGKWPDSNLIFSPRLGFSYDVLGDKTLKVRGGTGLFSGRLPLVFFTNMPGGSGMNQNQVALNASTAAKMDIDMSTFNGGLVTDANGKATIDALYQKLIGLGYPTTPGNGTVPSSISAVDSKFKMPQVWKTSLAVDYVVPVSFPLTVSVEGIFNKNINQSTISDWSIIPVEGFARWNGADDRPIYPSNFRNGTKAFVLENTSKGYGWSASVSITAKPVKWLNLSASYTHSVNKEITGLPGNNAESAFTYISTVNGPNYISLHNGSNVTPNRFIASATASDHLGNHYSLIYESWNGGYNYSYMLANDMNGDGYTYDALYIPTDKEVADGQFRFTSADDQKRFMDYVHSNDYLKNHQGEYAEAYSHYSPWVHRIDISYKHDFKVKLAQNAHKLQFSFDVKNVLNFFNNEWGVSKIMNPDLNSGRILKYEKTDADGYPVFSTPKAVNSDVKTFVPNKVIGQCWYAAIGVKYMFN
ncbi:MAG: carboxypeptidase regulatory-like domain-containing protein [Bacteroidaceae bacterium]|nr:carboxypeptidase regulatory-like domain-containing protein [Bacteroidaceae bacterium]